MTTRPAIFNGGHIVATPPAIEVMEQAGVTHASLLDRHFGGDWGDVSEFDGKMNDEALFTGARIWSIYQTTAGRLYVITEADRSSTCILRPEDY